jgi:DNA-binding NtrC family response regulator
MAFILVMEDNAALRRILVKTLTDDGHEVVESENGFAAYNEQLIHSVDLMITDLVMPRVDGLDAINTARSTRKDLKVIAMSGGGPDFTQDYLQVAIAFGASNIIHKPFEPDAMLDVVNKTLKAQPRYCCPQPILASA